MSDTEHLQYLLEIEAAANNVGLTTRRFVVDITLVIQVMEPSGQWATFDPIRQAKDVTKMLYAAAKKAGVVNNETTFRRKIMEEMINYDFSVPEKC